MKQRRGCGFVELHALYSKDAESPVPQREGRERRKGGRGEVGKRMENVQI